MLGNIFSSMSSNRMAAYAYISKNSTHAFFLKLKITKAIDFILYTMLNFNGSLSLLICRKSKEIQRNASFRLMIKMK